MPIMVIFFLLLLGSYLLYGIHTASLWPEVEPHSGSWR